MVVLLEREEVVEDLVLGDLGRFVDADPVAQAGDLDGVPKGHDVPLGDRRVTGSTSATP